ncbi:MAG: carboxypeptidase regulatory-like domain-containing protein [Terracidiphilus sp.]|nr:carboxypeptidase regulatory-like domain-containing protein [Terracidiphilus sp.]
MKRQGPGIGGQGAGSFAAKLWTTSLLALAVACGAQRPVYQTPSYKVAGTVVNTITGEPVRGATVKLLSQSENTALSTARTDDEGRFALTGISAGKYRLLAARRGYPPALYEQHENFSSAVVTGPEQDTEHLVFHLAPAAVLHGVVTADNGEPVEGARVELFRKPGVENPEGRVYLKERTMTDDVGEYEFGNLEVGDYQLAVMADPWYALHSESRPNQAQSELDVAYPVTYYDSTTEESAALPIRLGRGSRAEANIVLHAVQAIHITISAPGKDGSAPPATLRQSILGTMETSETATPNLRTMMTSTQYSLAPGHYELSAGTPPRVVELDATSSGPVDAGAGSPAGSVTGTVETAPGVPYDSLAVVTLVPAGGGSDQRELQAAVTKGRFNIEDVPAGAWTVKMMNGYGYSMQVNAIEVGKRPHASNRLTINGQVLTVVIQASDGAQTIQGFARREGKGVAGTMVVLVPQDLTQYPALARRDQSDSDGSFSLGSVFPGTYTVVALEDAWEMDWARPETISRYLPGGTSVTVSRGAAGVLQLEQTVAVQSR